MAFPDFPTDDDVTAMIRHQYSPDELDEIVSLLGPINHDGHMGWTPARIRLAALAMTNGNKALISQWIELGNADCRDLQLAVEGNLGENWERECLANIVHYR